jgi:GNAT superfamily N-acetyltransferase
MDDHSDTDARTVGLVDKSVVSLRRLGEHDTAAVLALHEQLPDRDRYLRFFTIRPAHLEQLARQLTAPNSTCGAIGAFDGDQLIGVANYVVDHDHPQSAEVAIAVAHDHRVGVGTALLGHLGQIAIAHGIGRFTADVLATNHLMLQVLSDAGWSHKRLGDDGLVLHFQIDLSRHRRAEDRRQPRVGRPSEHTAAADARCRRRCE